MAIYVLIFLLIIILILIICNIIINSLPINLINGGKKYLGGNGGDLFVQYINDLKNGKKQYSEDEFYTYIENEYKKQYGIENIWDIQFNIGTTNEPKMTNLREQYEILLKLQNGAYPFHNNNNNKYIFAKVFMDKITNYLNKIVLDNEQYPELQKDVSGAINTYSYSDEEFESNSDAESVDTDYSSRYYKLSDFDSDPNSTVFNELKSQSPVRPNSDGHSSDTNNYAKVGPAEQSDISSLSDSTQIQSSRELPRRATSRRRLPRRAASSRSLPISSDSIDETYSKTKDVQEQLTYIRDDLQKKSVQFADNRDNIMEYLA